MGGHEAAGSAMTFARPENALWEHFGWPYWPVLPRAMMRLLTPPDDDDDTPSPAGTPGRWDSDLIAGAAL